MPPHFRIVAPAAAPTPSPLRERPASFQLRSEAPRPIPIFLRGANKYPEEPRSLRVSLRKDQAVLSDAALDREIALLRSWIASHPVAKSIGYLRSELDALDLEQGARAAAHRSPVPNDSTGAKERRIMQLRDASPDNAVYYQALRQEGLYDLFMAFRFMGVSPFDKVYTPEHPDYYEDFSEDDLSLPIKIGDQSAFNVDWRTNTIHMEGDQGDRAERVRDASWTLTPAGLLAFISHAGGGLTPFELALAPLALSREATITPFIKDSALLGYEMDWGGSGLMNHWMYARDGRVVAQSTSEAALVKENIGPLWLAIPGIGLTSILGGAARMGRGALGYASELSEASGLTSAFGRTLLKARFAMGVALRAPALVDETALAGMASADNVALVEMRGAGAASDFSASGFAGPRPAFAPPGSAIPAQAAAPSTVTMNEVLTADRSAFVAADALGVAERLNSTQLLAFANLAQGYLAYRPSRGAPRLDAHGWLRALRTGPLRRDAEMLFGSGYARSARTSTTADGGIVSLSGILRPSSYSDLRLEADLVALRSDPGVWARLSALLAGAIRTPGQVSLGHLNILKGNIGEILAWPILNRRLETLQQSLPGLRMEYNARIVSVRGGAAKLAADTFYVTESDGNLFLHEVVEIKAGARGGQEATTQFFEWRENRLEVGDQLELSDGRRFTYNPARSGTGYVRGFQSSPTHIVAARDAELLGTESGDQVAATGIRSALPQSAAEISYLARVLLESLP